MIRKLKGLTNRLTKLGLKIDKLKSVIKQLKEGGAKEGKDFIVKKEDDPAVWLRYEAFQPDVARGIYKK